MSSPRFTDGYYGSPVPTSTAPRLTRPFKDAIPADTFARTLERRFLVDPRAHSPRLSSRTSYTNQLTYSEDFSNGAWSFPELTRTAGALANPWDGQLTFTKFPEKATTADHGLARNYTFTAVPHVLTALVAPGLGRSYVRLSATDGTTSFIAFFNLVDGVVHGTPSNCTASIKRYADGSCRCSITFTPLAILGTFYVHPSPDGSTISYLGDVTKGFYCGGVQIERASTTGPYIVTTSAARTVSVPDVDGIYNSGLPDPDDFAFHTAETDVDTDATAPAPLSHTYATIPAPQSKPISKWIDRPSLHNLKVTVSATDRFGVSIDDGASTHIFAAASRLACTGAAIVAGTYEGQTVVTDAGHGLTAGQRYVAWAGDQALFSGVVTLIYDADNFYIDCPSNIGTGITYYCLQSAAAVRYVNGAIEADCQEVTTFYLLGFSPVANGAATISTSAEIPLTARQMAPAAWFAVLEAYRAAPSAATTAVESTQGKTPYAGQILGYTYTKLQVADVYETQAV